jgi:hypothetical protein
MLCRSCEGVSFVKFDNRMLQIKNEQELSVTVSINVFPLLYSEFLSEILFRA